MACRSVAGRLPHGSIDVMHSHLAQLRSLIVKRRPTYLVTAMALALLIAACSSGYTASAPKASPAAGMSGAASSPRTSHDGSTIAVASTRLGHILVDGSGRTVYLFEADKGRDSVCYKQCAQAWPPVTAAAASRVENGASGALLGTTRRTDGATQVTYGGHPLYYFIADRKPGDMNGQGLNQFGAKWYVLSPNGEKIDTD
jgi:predicted lipoprotein with Yx(FWY)xxD motif